MIPQPRLSNQALAELCHRLGMETESGIDIRRSWQREADWARGRTRPHMTEVRDAVARGDSLTAALERTGRLFPQLFREMVAVGEQTGTLAEVFHRLAHHYRHQHQTGRTFLLSIAWPMVQLVVAIVLVGVMILVLGVVAQRGGGQPVDVLGFGLIGTSGLVIYANVIIVATLCVAGLVYAVRRGALWTRPLQRWLMLLPGIGSPLQKIALARVTWVLNLVLNVEMDLRRALPLVLRATGNDFYIRHTDQIVADVSAGHPLWQAFANTQAFPSDFLDALAVAEESGRIVESMDRLSRRYEEESEAATRALAIIGGFLIWGLVAALIIWLIFRLAAFYLGTINQMLDATR